MVKYATGEVKIREWTSRPGSPVNVTVPGNDNFPNLLFHDVGEWSKPGGIMAEVVSEVFRPGHNTCVSSFVIRVSINVTTIEVSFTMLQERGRRDLPSKG